MVKFSVEYQDGERVIAELKGSNKRYTIVLSCGKKLYSNKGTAAQKIAKEKSGLLVYSDNGEVIFNFNPDEINLYQNH